MNGNTAQDLTRQELERNSQDHKAHRLHPWDVELTRNAMITVGSAVKDIAARVGVNPKTITRGMFGEMYWLEPSNRLMIVLPVPRIDADMFIEIPENHWRIRERNQATQ
jgi:hypothetical protein